MGPAFIIGRPIVILLKSMFIKVTNINHINIGKKETWRNLLVITKDHTRNAVTSVKSVKPEIEPPISISNINHIFPFQTGSR